jgi:hypothetical protein
MTTPRMAAATVLSIVIFLGLAVAGAGGAPRFFSYPPLIAVALATIALGFAAVASLGVLLARIQAEERMLSETSGA